MPADLLTKTKIFGKQYKCLVMERKDAVQYENALEPSIIRCYTDGSKLNGRAGASFYIEYVSGSQTDQNFFHLGKYSTVEFVYNGFAYNVNLPTTSHFAWSRQNSYLLCTFRFAYNGIAYNVNSNTTAPFFYLPKLFCSLTTALEA